jgi:hypothetical protein
MRAIIFFGVAATLLAALPAFGQQRYRSPYGPTMSPYLEYLRAQPGVVPNYYQFIRPQRELRQTLNQYDRTLTQEQRQIQKLEGELQQIKESPAAATGTGATFQNYSHYYRMNAGGGRK